MAEAQIPCTYTLKDTKKESNWSYEDGALHVKNRLAILRDENGSKIGESLVLTAAQKQALEALGWCGGDRTCDDELKLKFPGHRHGCVQERDEPMPPPPPRARRKAAPVVKPAKRFKQFRRPAAPVPQAPVQAEAEDDEPSDEKKPFAFLAGRNYGVRPRDAPPPPRPGGWAAAPPDAPVRTSRVVERCDGGFDDSWLGSDSDASDDEAPPPAALRATTAAATRRRRRAPAPGSRKTRCRRPRRPSPTTPSRRPSSTPCSTARRTSRPRRGTSPRPRAWRRPRRPRRRRRRRPRLLRSRRRRRRRDESRCRPCRGRPCQSRRAAPAPAPPTDDDDDAFWAAAADAASRAEAAAGATAPVAFEDASVTRERQRREPRGPPLTGEERRQRAADAADATTSTASWRTRGARPDGRGGAQHGRRPPGRVGGRRGAGARDPAPRRSRPTTTTTCSAARGPRGKAPRPPGAALDELEARTTATPMRRTDARAAADIADSWLAARESSIQNDGARPKKTPSSTLPQSRDDELRAPEDDVRSFVATRLSRAKTPKTPRTRMEALVDLLVEPDLHTYRQARALVGSSLEAAFYHAARGALAAANDDATLDKNVVAARAGRAPAAARDGTLVDEPRRGDRERPGRRNVRTLPRPGQSLRAPSVPK